MFRTPERRFLYNAHAVALAGAFTKPRAEFLEAQAVSALPVTGGLSTSRVENFRFRDLVSFRLAHSYASGTHNPETGAFNTLVTTVIEGFDIMGVLTADKIVSRLASRHFIAPPKGRFEDKENPNQIPEPSILTLGSHIENLRLTGQPVELTPDPDILAKWKQYSSLQEGCRNRENAYAAIEEGSIITSIFKAVDCKGGVEIHGHRIDFEEFGSIYLGEIHVQAAERRLTMIRFELGCSNQGDGGCGEVGGNGSPVPPLSP
jgi:hypothetical protein